MLLAMIKKDIKLHMKDFQFQIMFIVCLSLFLITGYRSTGNWKGLQEEYQSNVSNCQAKNSKYINNMMASLQSAFIYYLDEPNSSLLVSNTSGYPTGYYSSMTVNKPQRYDVHTPYKSFFRLNWLYIIGVLGSLMALLFSYDVISREKQNGTFRLMIVDGVSRINVVLSKFIAIFFLFIIAMVPGILLSVLTFSLMTGLFSWSLIMKFIMFLAICLPFISFFILCGLLISTGKNYRNNIIVTMTLWLLFIIIIPESASIIGKQAVKVKTDTEYRNEISTARNQAYDKWYEIAGGDKVDFNSVAGNMNLKDGLRAKGFHEMSVVDAQIFNKQSLDLFKQKEFIQKVSSFSPFGLLDNMTEVILEMGYFRFRNILKQFGERQSQVEKSFIEIDRQDPRSVHLFYSGASGDTGTLSNEGLVAFTTQSYPKPEQLIITQYRETSWSEKLRIILIPLLILIGMNLLLWLLLTLKMKNFDVR